MTDARIYNFKNPPSGIEEPDLLVNAHAHGDCEHLRPLLDALDQGFCSVEADVFVVDGQLLVAHDPEELLPERSLEALYLKPLHERFLKYGGHIYPKAEKFTLVLDLKIRRGGFYPVLRELAVRYADMLSIYENGVKRQGAVDILLSGERDLETLSAERIRYAAGDGDFGDMGKDLPPNVLACINLEWRNYFSWNGEGRIPDEQMTLLECLARQAHHGNLPIRIYGTPDTPAVWKAEIDSGIDLINTDRLAEFHRFICGLSSPRSFHSHLP